MYSIPLYSTVDGHLGYISFIFWVVHMIFLLHSFTVINYIHWFNVNPITHSWGFSSWATIFICWDCGCAVLSHVWFFVIPWTGACQALLSMEFFRQEHFSGLPFLTPGDLPDPGIEPVSLVSPALAGTWEALTLKLTSLFSFCLKPLLSFGIKDILTSQQELENVPFLFSGRIWFCLSSSSKYFIIEHLVEFSGKEFDFCPTNPEGAKSKLKLPVMFFNIGKSSQAVLVLSDFTNLFRICLTFPLEFVWHFPTYLFIYFKLVFLFIFDCAGSLLLCTVFSSCSEHKLLSSYWCTGFSLWWLLLSQSTGSRYMWASTVAAHWLTSCGIWALELRLSSCGSHIYLIYIMWNLPGPGIRHMSPALAGRFLSTESPGKSSPQS